MPTRRFRGLAAASLFTILLAPPAAAQGPQARPRPPLLDVPFVATPHNVVDAMLRLAGTGPDDAVYDLGSGDGRIVIAAVRDFDARLGVGVDLDPKRVAEGRANAAKAGVADRTRFERGDVFRYDFTAAKVLTMYLSPRLNRELRPRLLVELKPGTRVVSFRFTMGDWEPDRTVKFGGRTDFIHLWIVPARADGRWRWTIGGERYRMTLVQTFQFVDGRLDAAGRWATIRKGRLAGDRLTFETKLGDTMLRFDGRVAGDRIVADVEAGTMTRVSVERER